MRKIKHFFSKVDFSISVRRKYQADVRKTARCSGTEVMAAYPDILEYLRIREAYKYGHFGGAWAHWREWIVRTQL